VEEYHDLMEVRVEQDVTSHPDTSQEKSGMAEAHIINRYVGTLAFLQYSSSSCLCDILSVLCRGLMSCSLQVHTVSAKCLCLFVFEVRGIEPRASHIKDKQS
jgi:hypothetical protein